MKKRFYFRKTGGFSFPMEMIIHDDRHEANIMASMVRKGYEVVDTATYLAERAMFAPFRSTRLSYGGRKF